MPRFQGFLERRGLLLFSLEGSYPLKSGSAFESVKITGKLFLRRPSLAEKASSGVSTGSPLLFLTSTFWEMVEVANKLV